MQYFKIPVRVKLIAFCSQKEADDSEDTNQRFSHYLATQLLIHNYSLKKQNTRKKIKKILQQNLFRN